ncbi:hypothetical protein E2C01_024375 [Portunus trituberculatus]|uniref:Uncharacterized protein n=1 Tax=Portunus trituberculatus TaxID=210409 RepID=A0A5B7ED02_PORTR|nr:hypothetical protein [Portunus trituberculatus]
MQSQTLQEFSGHRCRLLQSVSGQVWRHGFGECIMPQNKFRCRRLLTLLTNSSLDAFRHFPNNSHNTATFRATF